MNSGVCPSCGATQAESLLCNTEVLRLRADLNAVPALVEDLAIAISKQARLNTHERGSKGSAHERWAIDVDASAVAWELEDVLTKWATHVSRVLNYPAPARAATSSAALIRE